MKTALQIAAELMDARKVFASLECDFSGGNKFQGFDSEYSTIGETVLMVVRSLSKGFQKDVASKAYVDGIRLSDKQRWCVAFEFVKLAPTLEQITAINEAE